MVRLEEETQKKGKVVRIKFQFQYGAIRGKIFAPLVESYSEFQFQYGAIRGLEDDRVLRVYN